MIASPMANGVPTIKSWCITVIYLKDSTKRFLILLTNKEQLFLTGSVHPIDTQRGISLGQISSLYDCVHLSDCNWRRLCPNDFNFELFVPISLYKALNFHTTDERLLPGLKIREVVRRKNTLRWWSTTN